jgi:NAD(P)-dependent dehydrogenase (short-subunit alcohol dehydrogenase family)
MKEIAVVTGANRGLGFGVSEALIKKGYHVIMVGRDASKLSEAASKLEDSGFETFAANVTSDKDMDRLADHIEKEYGYCDVLINNAGVLLERGESVSVFDEDPSLVLKSFDVNAAGALRASQSLLPLLKNSKHPRIVQVSSGMGQLSDMDGGYAGYRMSKSALNALTKILHSECGGQVKVNSVCPGWVRTDMGGANANRSLEEGVASILWAVEISSDGPSGGFFRDGKEIPW